MTPYTRAVDTISFARGVPAPECLPVEELADCAQVAIERDGAAALLYGHTLGYQPLREWIAERHGIDPARVVVTNGSLQAFHFVLGTLGEGRRIVVERPTYDRPRKILSAFDEVAVDDEGLDVDELEGLLARVGPAFLYTIPTFQNPSGVTLSGERRSRIAKLAADGTLLVFEDDPYGLVRFDGELYFSVPGTDVARLARLEDAAPRPVTPPDSDAILAPWEMQPTAAMGLAAQP